MIPPKDLQTKLKTEADDYHKVLSQANYRVQWAKFQERERQKEAEAVERERGTDFTKTFQTLLDIRTSDD